MKRKMKNKFTNGAIEAGQVDSLTRIELTGCCSLQEKDEIFKDVACEDTCFSQVFGFEHRFLYVIEAIHDNEIVASEKGLGYIEQEDDKIFLIRETPLSFAEDGDVNNYKDGDSPLVFPYHEYVRVFSYVPKNVHEMLATPYSVLASISPHAPSPVILEENTLLGRKDDIVQAIDKEELVEIMELNDVVKESIEKTQKQLTLKTRRLDLSRKNSFLSSPYILLKPDAYDNSNTPPSLIGTLFYNTELGKLQLFDGNRWRTIKFEDED